MFASQNDIYFLSMALSNDVIVDSGPTQIQRDTMRLTFFILNNYNYGELFCMDHFSCQEF